MMGEHGASCCPRLTDPKKKTWPSHIHAAKQAIVTDGCIRADEHSVR
jgi:hypothetical protein